MRLLAISFLFMSLGAFSQKNEVFQIDSLPKEGILLDKGWKWHAGDNPDFAKADFDDSKWEAIDPTKDIMDLPQIRQAEIGYLTITFWIDSSLVGKPIALSIHQSIASEIFFNGKSIYHLGVVSSNKNKEQIFITNGHPYSIVFNHSGFQRLSVRASFTKHNILLQFRPVRYPFFEAKISKMDETLNEHTSNFTLYAFLDYFKVGILLFLALLHLFLFVSLPEQKVNLYIFFYAICQLFPFFADVRITQLPLSGSESNLLNHWSIFLLVLGGVFSLLIVYEFLKTKKGIWFWSMLLLIVLGYPLGLYFPTFGPIYNAFILSSVLAFESIRISLKTKRFVSKYIIMGWVLYILFMVIFYLFVFRILPFNITLANLSVNFGLMSIPICYSLILVNDYVRNNRSLLQKLIEVESLSAEKQQILASQNVTLEKQVEERTAELLASQKQLIQSEKLASLGELTAGIAHEIQNPLNFVNNFSELSEELIDEMNDEIDKGNNGEVKAIASDLKLNLEKIHHHGKRASFIVKGMLEHSRTSTSEKELTDINALADEYLRLAYHGLRAKDKDFNSDFRTNFDENLPNIKVIPQDIGRVLLNLINNAFYACAKRSRSTIKSDEKSLVVVSTKKVDNQLIISVKDNGIGMSEEVKAKIFQPFFTTKPTGQGTGLGLSLAYDIITKGHCGKLEVKSEEGVGSEFVISLSLNSN